MPVRSVVQMIITGATVVGRAFGRAIKSEMDASRQAAKARSGDSSSSSNTNDRRQAAADALSGMSLSEAKQILNVDEMENEEVLQKYEHLFTVNEKTKGGSFYLQSKVYRAKERLDQEFQAQTSSETKKKQKESEQRPS